MKSLPWTLVSRRSLALVLLGFACGLPLAISGDWMAAWLTDNGFKPSVIGLLGWVALPYALKVIWSPLIDRFTFPFLGRRRGWMLVSQLALIAAILALARTDPRRSLVAVGVVAGAVAFFSATLDTVVSAWQVDILEPRERGVGAAIMISGYRVGMIASGAGTLILVGWHWFSWQETCVAMAAAMMLGLLGVWLATEPPVRARPQSLAEAVAHPLMDLLAKPRGLLILLFALIFKFPEYLANSMSVPFLMKIGFNAADVGTIRQGMGIAVTIVGAFLGGLIVRRWGAWRSLWLFGVLHSVSNLAFMMLAQTGANRPMMVAVITVESLCVGMTTTGFIAWMIGQCDKRFSAFQYALLSGTMALGRVLASPLGGGMADRLGWREFFFVSALFGIPGLILLPWIKPPNAPAPLDLLEPLENGLPAQAIMAADR
jgi:PAT family beta-lactamase induction signal transducer AmpG